MNIFPPFQRLLLALSALFWPSCLAFTDGDCAREKPPGSVFYATGAFDQDKMSPDACKLACSKALDANIDVVGITNGNVCLCGKDSVGRDQMFFTDF